MTLMESKKQVDRILASLFYDRMKDVQADPQNARQNYIQAANETGALLMHMKERLDILFGQDPEALTQFLANSGIVPVPFETTEKNHRRE